MLSWLLKAWRANDGLAAVEFAFIAPVMLALFLGSVELTGALDCEQKVTGMASTAADLIAQETQVTNSDLANVLAAMDSIVYPYPGMKAAKGTVIITSLIDNGKGGGTVAWSEPQGSTGVRVAGSTVAVPAGVISSGGSVILTEVTYPYTSTLGKYLPGITTMTSSFYARPRRSVTIARVP
jgi:Flp pilus assembly protein TadG